VGLFFPTKALFISSDTLYLEMASPHSTPFIYFYIWSNVNNPYLSSISFCYLLQKIPRVANHYLRSAQNWVCPSSLGRYFTNLENIEVRPLVVENIRDKIPIFLLVGTVLECSSMKRVHVKCVYFSLCWPPKLGL